MGQGYKMNETVELQHINLANLRRGRYQTREKFSVEAINELAQSIKSQGLVQPLIVCQLKENSYEVVAGERRWRAALQLKLKTVPCLVKSYTQTQMAAIATIENLQREDLNAIEEANAFLTMVKEFSYTHEEVALIVGKSRAYVTNSLRLLKLDLQVQALLIDNLFQVGHAKVLAKLTKSEQRDWAKICNQKQWSVRQLEKELQKRQTMNLPNSTSIGIKQSVDIRRLEGILAEQVGTEVKVELIENKSSGWFKVKFYDADTLSGLLSKMGLKEEG